MTLTNKEAYDACVKLTAEQRWWATHTAITEEGRPEDGTDWHSLLADWTNESQSTQQS
jgi:hypothetical protein